MWRIRFHGRGGQGMKTAARILGSAFFAEGFEVQDAPLYGAERRGAPIFATVRASRSPIHERGPVRDPDLVVVADDTLVHVAAASVLLGVGARTTLLLRTSESAATWRERLHLEGSVHVLPAEETDASALRSMGAACAGAAARLTGALSRAALERALRDELTELGPTALASSTERALAAWASMETFAGSVSEGPDAPAASPAAPEWIDVPNDSAAVSEPAIRASASSLQVRTGLWRLMRPVLDTDHCHHCTWICTTFCPDGAISAGPERLPEFDLDHCKGCMVCVAVCPTHAIRAVPEREAAR